MRTPEQKSGWERSWGAVRTGIVSGASLALGLAACSSSAEQVTPQPAPTETAPKSPEDAAYEMWGRALYDLRAKVDKAEPIDIQKAEGICVYWPSTIEGVYTVVRNPILYTYREDKKALVMFPFAVTGLGSEQPILNNGPFMAYEEDGNGRQKPGTSVDNMGSIWMPGSGMRVFLGDSTTLKVDQQIPATAFTAAWALDDNGQRLAETKIVFEEDLATAFGDSCEIIPPAAKNNGAKTQTA